MKDNHRLVLEQMLAAPTAPFHEQAVVGVVRQWAQRAGVDLRLDRAGNVVLELGRGTQPKWVLTAHIDHPGFIVRECRAGSVTAEFLGSVRKDFFIGSRVRFFGEAGEVGGRVTAVTDAKAGGFMQVRVKLDARAKLPASTVGMWDFPSMRVRGNRLSGRGCDDVAGAAALLCALEDLAESSRAGRSVPRVMGLLTRAEEVGFIGAMGACQRDTIPRKSLVVGIETSKAQAAAPLGGGVVVRVGDAARTFEPALTAHVTAIAAALRKADGDFHFTRQLMPGGTCESTAYQMYGLRATALCVPLGNYHNMGAAGKIAPEQIDLRDFASLVKLLVAIASDDGNTERTEDALRKRLRELLQTRGEFL